MKSSTHLAITKLLTNAAKRKITDIHLTVGNKPAFRKDEQLLTLEQEPEITQEFLSDFLSIVLDENQKKDIEAKKTVRTTYTMEDKMRFRVTVSFQQSRLSVAIKLIDVRVPTFESMGFPESFKKLTSYTEGLVIISGPYSSGKTSLAAVLVNEVNKNRSANIVTLEEPVEFVFINDKSIIQQRQIGRDVESFKSGIEQCRNEDIDVILISENHPPEIIPDILALAASGKLIFYLSETISVVQTLERIMHAFKPIELQKEYEELSEVLRAVVSLRLVPRLSGGRALVYEILFSNRSTASLVREGKIQQLTSIMQTSPETGMMTLDQNLYSLVRQEIISAKVGLEQAVDKENFAMKVRK